MSNFQLAFGPAELKQMRFSQHFMAHQVSDVGTYRGATWWAGAQSCVQPSFDQADTLLLPLHLWGRAVRRFRARTHHTGQIPQSHHGQQVARDPLLPAHGQPFSLRATKALSLTKMSLLSTALKAPDPKPTLSNPGVSEMVPGRAKETVVQAMHTDAKYFVVWSVR